MKKLAPIHDLDRLDADERAKLWTDMDNGLSYSRAVSLLATEHFILIKRHKLYRWWHLESDRRAFNAHLAGQYQLDPAAYLALLNGQSLPWPDLLHTQIHKAAFVLTCRDDNTPGQLLTLQRIANNQFNQQVTLEKLALENRKANLREETVAAKNAETAREAQQQLPRVQTPEEIEAKKRQVETAFRAHPLLRHFSLPWKVASPPVTGSSSNEPPSESLSETSSETSKETLSQRVGNQVSLASSGAHAPDFTLSQSSAPSPGVDPTPINTGSTREAARQDSCSDFQPGAVREPDSPTVSTVSPSPSSPAPPTIEIPASLSPVESHALRRWAAHVPRPRGVPTSDDSWVQECPCGTKLPCAEHQGLWRQVRYLAPWSPDYAGLLRLRRIPVHYPTIHLAFGPHSAQTTTEPTASTGKSTADPNALGADAINPLDSENSG